MATLGQYNPKDYTLEQIALLAATHLEEQGQKSEVDYKTEKSSKSNEFFKLCVYNGIDGKTCGAGPFVQNYKPEMERTGFSDFTSGLLDENKVNLINSIQHIHDVMEPDDWKSEFYMMFTEREFNPKLLDNLYNG